MGLSVHSMRFYKPELVEYAYCSFGRRWWDLCSTPTNVLPDGAN